MSYFSSKDREPKAVAKTGEEAAPRASASSEQVSTLGPGMIVTGNITSTGTVQIHGRVVGDIDVARLVVAEGANVEGKIVAQDAVIDGRFKGSIHGDTVKLRATAVVEGEIFNKSLMIEENAQFEGVARRLGKTEAPAKASVVPISRAAEQAQFKTTERV